MDLEILKKKISTYRTEGGHIKIKDDGLLLELLSAWEQWTGPSTGFSSALGVHRKAIPGLIGKAKRLRREGFPSADFKEIKVEGGGAPAGLSTGPCVGIELGLTDGKVIRLEGRIRDDSVRRRKCCKKSLKRSHFRTTQ